MDLAFFERLSKTIAVQFGSNCEVAVHDLKSGDREHTIAVIENGHVSHRKVGDGPSRVVLEALKEEDPKALEDQAGYLMRTHDGRILKCSTVYIRDEDGVPEGTYSPFTVIMAFSSAAAGVKRTRLTQDATVST